MSQENITLKVILVRQQLTEECLKVVSRKSLNGLLSKRNLMDFVLNRFFNEMDGLDKNIDNFRIQRKSKKKKRLVSLEAPDDFKELARSLKVKNHVNLVIHHTPNSLPEKENAVTDAVDQVKRFVSELQKSELWDILKSFASAYDTQLSPDEGAFRGSHSISPERENSTNETIHEFVACDSCHPEDTFGNIRGKRYKCVICDNFDLCEKCHLLNISILKHKPEHPMLEIPDSQFYADFCHGQSRKCSMILKQESQVHEDGPNLKQARSQHTESTNYIEECVSRSDKYLKLEALLEDNVDLFETLKALIRKAQVVECSNQESVGDSSPACQTATSHESTAAGSRDHANFQEHPGVIEVTVVPKGTSLSQVILTNKSESSFDCSNLNFQIQNCLGKTIATACASKSHALLPGRCSKFNILVNNSHFKYPFRLTVKNGISHGSCELSLNSLTSHIAFAPEEDRAFEAEQEHGSLLNNEKPKQDASIERKIESAVEDDHGSHQEHLGIDSEDDYDMISLADADEIGSDFEVLSEVNSHEFP